MKGIAGFGAEIIHTMRSKLELTEGDPKDEVVNPEDEKKPSEVPPGTPPPYTPYSPSSIGGGTGSGGSSGAGKIINMTLNVINNFNVKDGGFMKNKEEIVDYVVGRMNDSLKDALITAG